jgi:hypothetical protein
LPELQICLHRIHVICTTGGVAPLGTFPTGEVDLPMEAGFETRRFFRAMLATAVLFTGFHDASQREQMLSQSCPHLTVL